MNNQAAQTMPFSDDWWYDLASRHASREWNHDGYLDSIKAVVNDALSQTAGVTSERIAPVQGYTPGIPWSMHLEAYDVYCKRYGKQQALIEGGCRGGFGTNELDMFIPGWRDRLSEFNAMKARIAELEAMLAAAPAASGGEDAARYRFIRDPANFESVMSMISIHNYGCEAYLLDGEELDTAIDAARAGERG